MLVFSSPCSNINRVVVPLNDNEKDPDNSTSRNIGYVTEDDATVEHCSCRLKHAQAD